MEQALLAFHELVDSIWTQKCKEEDFTTVLQQAAQLKAMLWSADLMQAKVELRLQFFSDMKRIEIVARQVLSPEVIKEMNGETRTYYGYLYAFLCQYSNDLLMIYNEFPFQIPIHIACGFCGNDIHSVLVNPSELNEKNTTTVVPIKYEREKDGLNLLNEKKRPVAEEGDEEEAPKDEMKQYSESKTPEGFGEKEYNEWDFFSNTMRFLDMCGEEYLSGILNYLYGTHECTKCHKSEKVIASYKKWFYANQPDYDEPKRELIDWLEANAKELSLENEGELASFFYRMAACYEMSRNIPDRERIYDYILSYYEENTIGEHDNIQQVQYVLRELLETDFEKEKARAYNRVAAGCGFDYSNEEKNRWDLTWQAYLKAAGIYQKIGMLDDSEYWKVLNGLCITVTEGGQGNIDLVDELILDYIERLEGADGEKEDIGEAYNRLAYMWAESAGDYEKCYAYFDKYLEISKQIYGADSDFVADLYEELADYYEEDGDDRRACELRERALEINVREMGEMYLLPPIFKGIAIMAAKVTKSIDEEEKFTRVMSAADSYLGLGKNYYELSAPDKAMDCFKKAGALYEWEFKGRIPIGKMAEVHQFKGNVYLDEGNEKQARKEYGEAMEICNQLIEFSNYEEEIEHCKEILADILNEMGEKILK